MNVGELKHHISILEKTALPDSVFKEEEWVETKKTWAKIEKETRSREVENDRVIEEVVLIFTIRYQTITTKSKIEYEGKTYTIEAIEDVDFEKRFLELQVKEVV